MITEDERIKRKKIYETAKRNSEDNGIKLTPETESLMAKYINGDISDQEFFVGISKIVVGPTNYH
jgi:phosphodiesterase/alkaline phosphatase D-like protein